MKKKLLTAVAAVLIAVCAAATAGCYTLGADEAFALLSESCENSVEKWGDIYRYEEKITRKAESGAPGYIKDSVVNVHCYHDGENYHKDRDYAVTIDENYYLSEIDGGGKETTSLTGSNNIICGNNSSTDVLCVTKNTGGESVRTYQSGVAANNFTQSGMFGSEYSLKSKLAELARLSRDDIRFVDTDDAEGGAQTRFMTTKLTFEVTRSYLESHPESVLEGDYVCVQIVNVNLSGEPDYRISSIYVYKTESLGGFSLAYDSYILSISYLGPNVSVPDVSEKDSDGNAVWNLRGDLWDGNEIAADALYVSGYIK